MTQAASSDHEGSRLVGLDFIPLPNFQSGYSDYEITCFIVVVINLRGLIPAVHEVLQLSEHSWKETTRAVRGKWRQKYAHTLEFRGYDDAAELLGGILLDVPSYR